jgi:hypothetical protein
MGELCLQGVFGKEIHYRHIFSFFVQKALARCYAERSKMGESREYLLHKEAQELVIYSLQTTVCCFADLALWSGPESKKYWRIMSELWGKS